MKKSQLILLVLSIFSINLFSQSLATNILFEQANTVYKGRVEKISYNGSDAEGDDFGVTTVVEKVYKNGFSGDKIGIRMEKLYEIDTLLNQILINYQFQIKEDSTYVFFIQRTEEFRGDGKYVYFTNLADNQIEGIPFSDELEKELQSFDASSYLKTNNYSKLPFKILFQSSPVALALKVQKIAPKKDHYLITGLTTTGKKITVKTLGLNCICAAGKIKENENYVFFLTPFEEGKYLLTDRWLGIFQLSAISKNTFEYYKNKKTATSKNF